MLGVLEVVMAQDERPVSINISAIPVAGIGGLGLVAMATVVSVFFPAIGTMMAVGLASGVLLAIALVALRRRSRSTDPNSGDSKALFGALRDERPDGARTSPVPERVDHEPPSTLAPRYSTL